MVAAMDPFDSVGVIDSYFPEAAFFTEFERFDRHLDKIRRNGEAVDFVTVCSPNYLHDSHIRFALRNKANVICEKPVVLNPWNLEALQQIENDSENNIYNILQLRLHPSIIEVKKKVEAAASDTMFDIGITYIASRGKWYQYSWKGDLSKSGGVATNIGIHFFDMLSWIFGPAKESQVHLSTAEKAAGYLELENARVRWFLSISAADLPEEQLNSGQTTYRSITINNEEVEFSDGFTDLHVKSYESILQGNGFSLSDTAGSIELVHQIRNAEPIGLKGNYHPFCA